MYKLYITLDNEEPEYEIMNTSHLTIKMWPDNSTISIVNYMGDVSWFYSSDVVSDEVSEFVILCPEQYKLLIRVLETLKYENRIKFKRAEFERYVLSIRAILNNVYDLYDRESFNILREQFTIQRYNFSKQTWKLAQFYNQSLLFNETQKTAITKIH